MAVPFFQDVMLPLLEEIADGQDHQLRSVREKLTPRFALTENDLQEKTPSGGNFLFANRVAWASLHLKHAGLLQSPKRGFVQITSEGKRILRENPGRIDIKFLQQFPSYSQKNRQSGQGQPKPVQPETQETPEELLESSYATLRRTLSEELLEKVKGCSPRFFEQLVVDLLMAMGYGGSVDGAAKTLGGPKDGGIDGIIKEDKLGLDWVCIQAKRWEGAVGRPIVQAFAGSMEGSRAQKGVLITTSTFSKEAKDYVNHIGRKIVLIDVPTLTDLMIDHDIGVSKVRQFVLKRIDLDYFGEEET